MTVLELAEKIGYGEALLRLLAVNGYVIVPIKPTEEMLEEAYYEAMAENAKGVWRKMVETSQRQTPVKKDSAGFVLNPETPPWLAKAESE